MTSQQDVETAPLRFPIVQLNWWSQIQPRQIELTPERLARLNPDGQVRAWRPLARVLGLEVLRREPSEGLTLSAVTASTAPASSSSSAPQVESDNDEADARDRENKDRDEENGLAEAASRCWQCHFESEIGSSHCEVCGVACSATPPSAATSHQPPPLAVGEHVWVRPKVEAAAGRGIGNGDDEGLGHFEEAWLVSADDLQAALQFLRTHSPLFAGSSASPLHPHLHPYPSPNASDQRLVHDCHHGNPSREELAKSFSQTEFHPCSFGGSSSGAAAEETATGVARLVKWELPREQERLKGTGLVFNWVTVLIQPVEEPALRLAVQRWGVLLAHSLRVVLLHPSAEKRCVPLATTVAKGAVAMEHASRFVDWLIAVIRGDPELRNAAQAYRLVLGGYDFARRSVDVALGSSVLRQVFTEQEQMGLQVFADLSAGQQPDLSARQRVALADFVDRIWGSEQFSVRLGATARRDHPKVVEFIYKTQHLDSFRRALALSLHNWETYLSGEPIAVRTSREQLRLIESTIKITSLVRSILDLLQPEAQQIPAPQLSRLSALMQALDAGTHWQATVMNVVVSESGLQTGDLIAYTLENDRYYMGHRRSGAMKAAFSVWFGAPVGHVSLVLQSDEEAAGAEPRRLRESHMWGAPLSKHSVSPFALGTFGNRFFSPRPERMIGNPRFLEAIHRALPEEPSAGAAIRKVLHMAATLWHLENAGFLTQTRNDASYRVLVALVVNTKSLRYQTWRDRASFGPQLWKDVGQMSCSEFVVRAWLQCLDLCGEMLARLIREADPTLENEVPLDGSTIFRDDIISGYRRVVRYSPGQLVYRVQRTGFSEEIHIPIWSTLFE